LVVAVRDYLGFFTLLEGNASLNKQGLIRKAAF
jgi:hypothetical protein